MLLLFNQPLFFLSVVQSAGNVEYTDCFSATSVLDMTLNNLMVRLR